MRTADVVSNGSLSLCADPSWSIATNEDCRRWFLGQELSSLSYDDSNLVAFSVLLVGLIKVPVKECGAYRFATRKSMHVVDVGMEEFVSVLCRHYVVGDVHVDSLFASEHHRSHWTHPDHEKIKDR